MATARAMGLLTYPEFVECVKAGVPRFRAEWLNSQQDSAVNAPSTPPVCIVAGPGTGKTTVLALRILRHVFVDGYPPETIMATTFTRKAAKELRSRILGWGVPTHNEASMMAKKQGGAGRLERLRSIDINSVQTGTLDSLAEEMIQDDRQPGEITPTVIEAFIATGLLRRKIILAGGWHKDADLESHLRTFNPDFPGVAALPYKIKACQAFADRVVHDDLDLASYAAEGNGYQKLSQVVDSYHTYLSNSLLMDFAMLEEEVLRRVRQGRLLKVTQALNALLVDEFQDTNYLQEQIYYELCRASEPALTVVGDDDQSIYRFRSATVEIFSDFQGRITNQLGPSWAPKRLDLIENYRSTRRIVQFFNQFISSEPSFQSARAQGKRPCIARGPLADEITPVLGMFRHTPEQLADDLCGFLGSIFRSSGWTIQIANGKRLAILPGPGSDFGDAVLLSSSASEWGSGDNPKPRLPWLLRQRLDREYGVEVFNPRGRAITEIPSVAQCLGLMLECVDPQAAIQNTKEFRRGAKAAFDRWRFLAKSFMAQNPTPPNLVQFVTDWGTRKPGSWPREWPLLELMFTLLAWFPDLQRHPEGQVYLEALARTIAEAAQVSSWGSNIYCTGTARDDRSVYEVIREVFEPLAEGYVEVDEDVMPYVPRGHFPVMTIHQAKGLEFPLVIVDVGSAFLTDHHSQRPNRFPTDGRNVHFAEDHVAPFSPVGAARTSRTKVQRAFDDLRRLYYVAKSRPEAVLLMVGLTNQMSLNGSVPRIKSVAMGDLFPPTAQGAAGANRIYDYMPAAQWSPAAPDNVVVLV